ncbi:MAG: ATP-binding protein [Candidatus Marinarcus sp.]|uniref:sensor histidine kinase n=1 Tax=Candidatus Marinarcus sp. TaxID=3100987 RepID=UPI003AFFB0CB
MLRIHQLFLRTFIFIFISILIATSLTTYFWFKSIYTNEVERNLSHNIDAMSVSLKSLDHLDQVVDDFKEKTNLRITIIDQAGNVLAESDKDKLKMENHLHRQEIIKAQEAGEGKAIRVSSTIHKELLYVVKKLTIQDKIIYIRMADYLNNIEDRFVNLSLQVTGIFTLFLIFAFVIIYFISNKIRLQTDKIMLFLTKLTKKEAMSKANLKNLNSNYTFEFYEISKLLRKVAVKITKKDKMKSKHTARLKVANKQKDEIISAISHEFKNPIAIISGYSETILTDKQLPKNMQESFLKKIYTNANKMSALIDRLRLTLKLEEGKQEGFFKQTSLKTLCEELSSDLKQKYKNRIIKIVGEDTRVNLDETLMSIAISNLVENALKYSEDVVTIEITPESLTVLDMGIGIAAADLERIKNKFYRVSKNDWNNSLGLGLFIVLKILNIHNYELQIISELNFGSKFIIKF